MIVPNNTVDGEQSPPISSPDQPSGSSKFKVVLIIFAVILLLALLFLGIRALFGQSVDETSHIRDIFIIIMALEALVVGAALIILIVQIAVLTNLIQNEVKPILESTNETANTLRGTATFLSNNLVEPVIKFNEYVAAIQQVFKIIRPSK